MVELRRTFKVYEFNLICFEKLPIIGGLIGLSYDKK